MEIIEKAIAIFVALAILFFVSAYFLLAEKTKIEEWFWPFVIVLWWGWFLLAKIKPIEKVNITFLRVVAGIIIFILFVYSKFLAL